MKSACVTSSIELFLKNDKDDSFSAVVASPSMETPFKIEGISDTDLFENAFHYAAIGMALVGLKGEWLKVNRSICELVGYTEDELRKLTFQDLTHPDDLGADLAQLALLAEGTIPSYRMEKRYFTKSGSIVWALLAVSMVPGPDGKALFYISQIKDITARKEAEAERNELLRNLEQTLREKETLLAELQRSQSEILNLRSKLVTICAWTKRVRCDDQWMSVDEFLVKELGLNLTHGMSAEAEEQFMKGDLFDPPSP